MRRSITFAAIALAAYAQFAAALDQTAPAPPVPAGTYKLDKPHGSLIFRVSHMGFSHFTARFTRFDAQLEFDPARLASSRVSVTIDPRSIESDNAPAGFFDELTSKEWLNAGDFPTMSFRSKSVAVTGPDAFKITGDLTLHGVTKPIVLDARYTGGYAGMSLDPHARIGFSAHGKFKRSDFGVSIGIPAPGSVMGVGDEVEVVIESEFLGPPFKAPKN
jgi:polyisoprenoid-binding protein YceI